MSPEDAPVNSNRNRDGAAQCVEMRQTMRQKLKRAGHRSRYPIAKADRGAGVWTDQASTRIFDNSCCAAVKAEWALICTAHNITKLAKAI